MLAAQVTALSEACIKASALMREVIVVVLATSEIDGLGSQLLRTEHLRDYEQQLARIFDRQSERMTFEQVMDMSKHRRYASSDATMRSRTSPTEIACSLAGASSDLINKLKELQSASTVEVTSISELRSRVPFIVSDSSDSEAEGASAVRAQARA